MSSSEYPIVKLPNLTDTLTLRVERCQSVKIGKWPEVEFAGVDTAMQRVRVLLPEKSAERQLERLNLTVASAVGETLIISRAPSDDPNRHYWNLDKAGKALSSAPLPARQQPVSAQNRPIPGLDDPYQPPDSPDDYNAPQRAQDAPRTDQTGKFDQLAALHDRCFTEALEMAAQAQRVTGAPATLEGISALTAQLFIAANQRGIS